MADGVTTPGLSGIKVVHRLLSGTGAAGPRRDGLRPRRPHLRHPRIRIPFGFSNTKIKNRLVMI